MTTYTKYPIAYAPLGHDTQPESECGKALAQKRFLFFCLFVVFLSFAVIQILFSSASVFNSTGIPKASLQTLPFSDQRNEFNDSSSGNLSSADEDGIRGPGSIDQKDDATSDISNAVELKGTCNIFKGDWIPDPSETLYSNATCSFIQDHQNCLKNGRPDRGYLHWRWKPNDCDLPRFDAVTFLRQVQGKSWAFIGDSIARNHFQSILCSLAQADMPENLYRDTKDQNLHWFFPSYKFTLAVLWSPFLAQETEEELKSIPEGTIKIFLDVADKSWSSSLNKYDYVVVSSGQWFLKPAVYLVKDDVVGCHYCPGLNFTQKGFFFAFRVALRTTFDSILSSDYKGIVFFRTFTPDHFENGRWDNGGNCIRTAPVLNNSTSLKGMTAEMYKIQMEEFKKALEKDMGMRSRLKLVDTIHASLLRPDGHPGPYRNFQPVSQDKNAKVQNDCLHWCLPGPIDAWNEMLLVMLKQL